MGQSTDVGAYPITGGNLHENASINVFSGDQSPNDGDYIYSPWLRCCLKGRSGDQEFSDGGSCLMRVVERVGEIALFELRWSGFGSVYSSQFDQNGRFHAPSGVHAGDSHLSIDGNIYGSVWGGYLNNWVESQISSSVSSGASSGTGWMKDERTGMISQAGRIEVSSGNMHVTFPVAFSSGAFAIVLTVGTTSNVNATYYNDNSTGFDLALNGGVQNDSLSWFSFGK